MTDSFTSRCARLTGLPPKGVMSPPSLEVFALSRIPRFGCQWPRVIAIAAVCALALLDLTACGASPRLKYYGQVPNFELTSQTGQKIALADLKGKVWVADTIYTSCTGPCPMMSARMHTVAKNVAALAKVRIVSITVDPAHDRPDALLTYSKHFEAAPDRWFFLTGPPSALNHLTMDGLHLSPVDGTFDHSTKFVLVDSNALIRGYYLP